MVVHHLHKDYLSELLIPISNQERIIVKWDFRKMAVLCDWAWKK